MSNLEANIRYIRASIDNSTMMCLAVKANGYGHGAVEIGKKAINTGVEYLAVATLGEGEELKAIGPRARILLLGLPLPGEFPRIIRSGISAVVADYSTCEEYQKAAMATGVRARLHLKIDTGMGRIGCPPEQAAELAVAINRSPYLELEGVCTHFPVADSEDRSFTQDQIDKFKHCITEMREAGVNPGIIHAANSAATQAYPDSWFNMVRVGMAAYGYPQAVSSSSQYELKPVMEFISKIVFLKRVTAGIGLSYGLTHTTKGETVIATVATGYADGYSRAISNRGEVLIRGKRYPVVGTVCMDQLLVDLGPDPDAELYDDVVLFGPDTKGPDAAEVARWAGTISYEVTCGINGRVPRIYK